MAPDQSETAVRSRPQASLLTGRVFDIQRYSIHDGPGIRTTVFLKGCPLRCLWCHNPESIRPEPLLSFAADKCIACGSCAKACPNDAHVFDEQRIHTFLRERCTTHGECARVCPSAALELVGRDLSCDEVLDQVLRDRPFYEASGGGLTLSGGEPLLQIEFAEALLKATRKAAVHTAVETAGHLNFDRLARVVPYTDLFLYDIKETDDARHRMYTGVPNGSILDNLGRLHDADATILVRLPIVPGLNDRQEHFREVAHLVEPLPRLLGVEVLPYHSLGIGKRPRFGLEPDADGNPEPPSTETVAEWVDSLRGMGVTVINEA